PDAACSSISRCRRLWNAIRPSMPGWLLVQTKSCHPQVFHKLPHSLQPQHNMLMNSKRPRLVLGVNSSIAVGFLQGQLQYFQRRGFDVTVLCPQRRRGEWEVPMPDGIPMIEVPMEREISPLRDFV